MASDKEIRFREMLITLEYLLFRTDEDHPAKVTDICEFAEKHYNLQYHYNAVKGDEIKRSRISECLQYLDEINHKIPDRVPFKLRKTKGNKYYIEEKNHLNEEQVIKVLAAVKNDRYTADEDTGLLIERLLDALTSCYNRTHIKDELKKYNRNTRKYNFETNRKLRLVTKAYNEQKMIKIRWEIFNSNATRSEIFDYWYRVYRIQEFRNKLYAFLIPISDGDLYLYRPYIFEAIENLNIPKLSDFDVISEDFNPDRNLERELRRKYRATEQMVRDMGVSRPDPEEVLDNNTPVDGALIHVSFSMRNVCAKFVAPSFREMFGTPLNLIPADDFKVSRDPRRNGVNETYFYDVRVFNPNDPKHYLVDAYVDVKAFKSWCLSDVHGDGNAAIIDLIEIAGPVSIKRSIASKITYQLMKFSDYVDVEKLRSILNKD